MCRKKIGERGLQLPFRSGDEAELSTWQKIGQLEQLVLGY